MNTVLILGAYNRPDLLSTVIVVLSSVGFVVVCAIVWHTWFDWSESNKFGSWMRSWFGFPMPNRKRRDRRAELDLFHRPAEKDK